MKRRFLSLLCCLALLAGCAGSIHVGVAVAEVTPTPITDLAQLPAGDSLIGGQTPILGEGASSVTNALTITDGKYHGLDQTIDYAVSDTQNTYKEKLAEAVPGMTGKYFTYYSWGWVALNTDSIRGVINSSAAQASIAYDMGGEARVDSVVLASSVELNSWQIGNAPTTVDNLNTMRNTYVSEVMLYSAKVYVGDDMDTLYDEANLVLEYDYSANKRNSLRNLFALPEAANGRYIGFTFPVYSQAVRFSELAVYGELLTPAPKAKKIVCVGDSITYGQVLKSPNVPTNYDTMKVENDYPKQLGTLLNAGDNAGQYTVVNAGIGGTGVIGKADINPTTNTAFGSGGDSWMTEQEKKGGYVQDADTVLIMLGTNDANGNGFAARAPHYKEFFQKITTAFREKNPDVEIYLLTSPYSPHSYIGNQVAPFQRQMAKELGLPLIDVYEATYSFVYDENDGDLSVYLHENEIATGLNLHPHEQGLGVIAQTVYDALTGDRNDLYAVKANGAQLRADDNTALRFSFTLPSTGITADAQHTTQLESGYITLHGVSYPVTGIGTVVGLADLMDTPINELTIDTQARGVCRVPAAKLYDVSPNGVTFTAVVTHIPSDAQDSRLVARGYVTYQDGAVERVAYGPLLMRCVADLLLATVTD